MGWSHGKRWTEQEIENELWEETKLLRRPPTYRELTHRRDLLSAIRWRGGLRPYQAMMSARLSSESSSPSPDAEGINILREGGVVDGHSCQNDSSKLRSVALDHQNDSSKLRSDGFIKPENDDIAELNGGCKYSCQNDSSNRLTDGLECQNDSSELRSDVLARHDKTETLHDVSYICQNDSSVRREEKENKKKGLESETVKLNVNESSNNSVNSFKSNNYSSDINLTLNHYIVSKTDGAEDHGNHHSQLGLLEDEPKARPKPKKANSEINGAARRIFDVWIIATGRNSARTILTPRRIKLIGARIRQGYPESALEQAIKGFAASPWHRGENPNGKRYDDLAWILKDGDTVERGIGYFDELILRPQLAKKKKEEEKRAEKEFLRSREERTTRAARMKPARTITPPQKNEQTWTSEELENLFDFEED